MKFFIINPSIAPPSWIVPQSAKYSLLNSFLGIYNLLPFPSNVKFFTYPKDGLVVVLQPSVNIYSFPNPISGAYEGLLVSISLTFSYLLYGL